MTKRIDPLGKLLPKTQIPDHDKDDAEAGSSLSLRIVNITIGVVTALLLAYVLVPRFPLLQRGETASRTFVAPYTMLIEYPGQDETLASWKINRGDIIVEAGSRVSDRAARALEELARREGVGNRRAAYFGLALLIVLIFYLFYRDINRYRPAFIRDSRKVFLLAFLLLGTILVAHGAKSILSLVTDKLPLDAITIGFALPVSAGAMLVCLLFDFHLASHFLSLSVS